MHTTIYIVAGAPEQYTEVYYIALYYSTIHYKLHYIQSHYINITIKIIWYFATGTVSNHFTDLEGLLHRTGYYNIPVKCGLLYGTDRFRMAADKIWNYMWKLQFHKNIYTRTLTRPVYIAFKWTC